MAKPINLLTGGVLMVIGAAFAASQPALAGKADVVAVTVRGGDGGIYSFDVTVKHADAGWSHYANEWDVVAPDGKVLGTRVLFHPHDQEQPFTRSLGGVKIPPGVANVTIRAHDKSHGWGGKEVTVKLQP